MTVILPPVPNVLVTKLDWTSTVSPGAFSHLFWQTSTSGVTNSQLTALAALVRSSFGTNLKAYMSSNWTLAQVTARDLGPSPAQDGIDTTLVAGTLAGGLVTAETATLINFVIGRRYRGGHPRVYWPLGNSTVMLDMTHWTTAQTANVSTGFAALINAVVAGGSGTPTITGLCSVSYYFGKALRPTPVVDPVIAWKVSQIPASQRRRMGR